MWPGQRFRNINKVEYLDLAYTTLRMHQLFIHHKNDTASRVVDLKQIINFHLRGISNHHIALLIDFNQSFNT